MYIKEKLLMKLQYDFPITRRPFKDIGNELKLNEDEVIGTVKELYKKGVIKRIAAHLEPMILNYKARALIGFMVDEADIKKVARAINKLNGLKHNYLRRDKKFNIWFTLKASSYDEITTVIEEFIEKYHIKDYVILPTKKIYKLDVRYDVIRGISWSPPLIVNPDKYALRKLGIDKSILDELRKGIEITERPFKKFSEEHGLSEEMLLDRIFKLYKYRILRYFGATLDSEKIGFHENAMIAFSLIEGKRDRVFIEVVKNNPEATHCIEREPDQIKWNYPGYIMVHSRDRRLIERVVKRIRESDEIIRYKVVYSEKNLGRIKQ